MCFLHQLPGVRAHFLTKLHILFADFIDLFPIAPHFIGSAGTAVCAARRSHLWLPGFPVAMKTHDGTERSPLEPAHKQFAEIRIVRISTVESADIRGPPGNSRQPHIQSGCQLVFHARKAGGNVAGPHQRAVSLASRPGTSQEIHNSFLPL